MAEVVVCILVHGPENYYRAGRQTALSVLDHSDFDVFMVHGSSSDIGLKPNHRLRLHSLPKESGHYYRARPFLRKFHALQACLDSNKNSLLMLLDSDAVLARTINKQMFERALGAKDLAMVEQTTILGSEMCRRNFLDHYIRHTLAWLDPGAPPPSLEGFRFYNSGVVLGRRKTFQDLVAWAISTLNEEKGDHTVGDHMIADQDYFQFWTNTQDPGCCTTLPWYWNHCVHWDTGFPRRGAYILHLSNFCSPPTFFQLFQMSVLRRNKEDQKSIFPLLFRLLNKIALGLRWRI
jgi:hypothetical protein